MFLENIKPEKILTIFNSAILLIVAFMLGFLVFKSFETPKSNDRGDFIAFEENVSLEQNNKIENEKDKENIGQSEEIYVDIKGAVKKPGVYKVTTDNIINDVIKLAGGLKSNASTKYTNLSKKVSNEMVITIYTTTQISKMVNPPPEVCSVTTENISNCQNSSIVETNSSSNATPSNSNEENTIKDNKVSLNNGTKEELMTLTGIGEAKADSIIEYREKNNGFKSLEELMNISGIGEKAYEKIKDNIKL